MFDKTGKLLEKGQDVLVPSPNGSDIHNHSFVGFVVDLLENRGTAIVEDQCSEFFEIEAERLIVKE